MSSATWSPATNGNSATWDENKTRADLQRAATAFDDPIVTFDSISVYFDGYKPTTTTPEGEAGATWSGVTNGSSTTWATVTE